MKANRRIRDLRRRSRGPAYCFECGHAKADHVAYEARWLCAATVHIRGTGLRKITARRSSISVPADCTCTGTSRRWQGSTSHTKTLKEAA